MRDCNANHPFFLPVRPIAKSFCEVWRLIPHSRFSSAILFAICCLLLFLSYVLTRHVTELAQELVYGTIEDHLKQKIVLTVGGWAVQLFVSNSSFFLFRVVLAGLIYSIYQMGRDVVFSILLILTCGAAIFFCFQFSLSDASLGDFIEANRVATGVVLFFWTLTIWYWRRYIFKTRNNHNNFDHEVGAALVRLQH